MEHRPQDEELVVLLHGIARTSRSMRPMESLLRAAGYRTATGMAAELQP